MRHQWYLQILFLLINIFFLIKSQKLRPISRLQTNYAKRLVPLSHLAYREEHGEAEDEPLPHDWFKVSLDSNSTIQLLWKINYDTELLQFEVHAHEVTKRPWLGIGFSNRGEFQKSDMCVFWVDWMGKVHFQNAIVGEDGRFRLYSDGECRNFRFRHKRGGIQFNFERKFNTCIRGHYVFERGTTHIVWSIGTGPLYRLEGVIATGDFNDHIKLELLKPNLPPVNTEDAKQMEFLVKKVEVPSQETTYWCSVQKLPEEFEVKHHMFEYGPRIQEGNEDIVHHMELFHCEHPPDFQVPLYQGFCHADDRPKEINACKRVVAAWAMGAQPFAYPEEAGMAFGGENYNPFVMLEVHYNNPLLHKGRIDSSGIHITYSEKLRRFDAGIMELGLEYTDKMAIPPQTPTFILSGYCIAECTALSLPQSGIYIFGSQFHTHLTGRRTWTKHFRQEKELEELNRDNHYTTHFQEIRRLPNPVHVLPGDALVMSCEFSTMDRTNVTVGGFSISDEMCVNYVHYYPETKLEVCKSSVDTEALINYFDFMKRMELENTSREATWRKNFEAIHWTPLRTNFLQQFYDESLLSMQCNRSSGDRFPGYWEKMPLPYITEPLKIVNKCSLNKGD